MVKCRVKILDGISVESMECLNEDVYKKKEKYNTCITSGVGMIKSLLVPTSIMNFMDSLVILQRSLTDNAVSLFY